MSASPETSPARLAAPAAALSGAVSDVQRLLAGRGGNSRWLSLGMLAAMAGAVGVGVQPPPLGLLAPIWHDPEIRARAITAFAPWVWLLLAAGLVLLYGAAIGRAFAFQLIHALIEGETGPEEPVFLVAPGAKVRGIPGVFTWIVTQPPAPGPERRLRRLGIRHFVWSSCLSVPLYVVLLLGEGLLTAHTWERVIHAGDAELPGVLLTGLLQFLLVLIPWVVLTLPAMVFQYELVPVAMIRGGGGPLQGAREVLQRCRREPKMVAGYLALRLILQVIGGSVMAMVGLLCAALVGGPLGGIGYVLSSVSGEALYATMLAGAGLFYVLFCVAILPLTALPFYLADRLLGLGPPEPSEPDSPTSASA